MYYLNIAPYAGHDSYMDYFILKKDGDDYSLYIDDNGDGWETITYEDFYSLTHEKLYVELTTLEDVVSVIKAATENYIYQVASYYIDDVDTKCDRLLEIG